MAWNQTLAVIRHQPLVHFCGFKPYLGSVRAAQEIKVEKML